MSEPHESLPIRLRNACVDALRVRRAGLRVAGACLAPLVALLTSCTHNLGPLQRPPDALALTTAGLNVSMIYLARVDAGVIVIDLGWAGAGRTLERGLERLGADSTDVVSVFLTHGHRDHIAGWRRVRGAPFHLPVPEVAQFLGDASYEGWIPRLVERLRPSDRPSGGEVRIVPFSRDTAFAFGVDTLRAFLIPGHTAGSAAYLFRGVLFVGDALSRPPLVGFRVTPSMFADDADLAARSLDALWQKIRHLPVQYVCTAHAKCAVYSPAFRRKVRQGDRSPG